MLWHIELKFCIWFVLLCYRSSSCVVKPSIFVGVIPLWGLRILETHSFKHFSPTCFDILSWNYAYDFVLLYYISSLSFVNLRQFLWELCPFWALEYSKYTVFRFFFFSYMLWHIELKFCIWLYFTVLHIKYECHQFASIFVGLMPLFGLRILEIHSIPHFFDVMLWHIELKFYIWLWLMYYRSSSSVVNSHQYL